MDAGTIIALIYVVFRLVIFGAFVYLAIAETVKYRKRT